MRYLESQITLNRELQVLSLTSNTQMSVIVNRTPCRFYGHFCWYLQSTEQIAIFRVIEIGWQTVKNDCLIYSFQAFKVFICRGQMNRHNVNCISFSKIIISLPVCLGNIIGNIIIYRENLCFAALYSIKTFFFKYVIYRKCKFWILILPLLGLGFN